MGLRRKKDILWYRVMIPKEFVVSVLKVHERDSPDIGNFIKDCAKYLIGFKGLINTDAYSRCVQLLIEYSELLHGGNVCDSLFEDQELLRCFVKSATESGQVFISSLEARSQIQERCFSSCVKLIVNKCVHKRSCDKVKNMIRWYRRIEKCAQSKVVCVDVDAVTVEELLLLQRIYEEVMMLRHPSDDISSVGSLWDTIFKTSMDKFHYNHSVIIPGEIGSQCWHAKCYRIKGMDNATESIYTLVLHNGKEKPPVNGRLAGMLEVMSLSNLEGICYISKKLHHDLLTTPVFVSDKYDGPCESYISSFDVKSVIKRINELKNVRINGATPSGDEEFVLDFPLARKLQPVTPKDYESNQLHSQAFCIDFLLWVSTRINTLRHSSS